jgi:hypothetical protein
MSESTQYNDEGFKRKQEADWASTSFTVYALLAAGKSGFSRQQNDHLVHANASLEPGTYFHTVSSH